MWTPSDIRTRIELNKKSLLLLRKKFEEKFIFGGENKRLKKRDICDES